MNKFLIALLTPVILAGCGTTNPFAKSESTSQAAESSSSAPSSSSNSSASSTSKTKKEVAGINGWKGYIDGTPAKNSRFNALKIGMGEKQVTDLIGPPTDQGKHITGKAFIPFYFGSGGFETVYHYKGIGRLRFANSHAYSTTTGLIVIEHDANEAGYR